MCSNTRGDSAEHWVQRRTFLLLFAIGQKLPTENKDIWSHWLQIQPLESTATALPSAIYYIHECDLWDGGWGEGGTPTCSTDTCCQEIKQASTSPSALLLPPQLQSHIGGEWPTFPSLHELLPGENGGMLRECVCVLSCLVCGTEQKLSLFPTVQTWEHRANAAERPCLFLLHTIVCFILFYFINQSFLILHRKSGELPQNPRSNRRSPRRLGPFDLKSTRHETNLPNKWIICQTQQDGMKRPTLHKFHCAVANCSQSSELLESPAIAHCFHRIRLILIDSDTSHHDIFLLPPRSDSLTAALVPFSYSLGPYSTYDFHHGYFMSLSLLVFFPSRPHMVTEYMGIRNESFMKIAAVGTWMGDFVTAWMVRPRCVVSKFAVSHQTIMFQWKAYGMSCSWFCRCKIYVIFIFLYLLTCLLSFIGCTDAFLLSVFLQDFVCI